MDQRDRWNYCAPANLTMALNFWGWKGNRDDVAKVVKPGENDPSKSFIDRGRTDRNVMPYELEDFVNDETEYRALSRYGGDIDLLKALVAAGFPPIAEKGYYEADFRGKVGWLGHYQFVTGYDDARGEVIVQDTWNDGPNFRIPYDKFMEGWRSFDFLFLVVYPADREAELLEALGPYADAQWAAQHALERANAGRDRLQGIDLFFAWFAKGTSHVALQQYVDAATAYDQAFAIYNALGSDDTERPYRMMWYQTGPYWAYFYSGRYFDVINLADTTLNDTGSTPTLEESLYWRGLAKYALGDVAGGIDDVRRSVYYNMNFTRRHRQAPGMGRHPLAAKAIQMKLLHFADAHIDMQNYGRHDPATGLPLRVLDFLKSLDTIVDTAISEEGRPGHLRRRRVQGPLSGAHLSARMGPPHHPAFASRDPNPAAGGQP